MSFSIRFAASTRLLFALPLLAGAVLLTGCEAKLGADLGVSQPAATIKAVTLAIPYVDFEDSDGAIHSFDTERGDAFDTLQHYSDSDSSNDADTYKLFSDNSAKGNYVSVRPRFDVSNASITDSSGAQYPLSLAAQPDYQSYALDIGNNDSANLVLTLELPFSLINQVSSSGSYELQPVIRVARVDTAGTIAGTIATGLVQASGCRNGRTAGTGVAAYLYTGSGVTPSDYFRTDTVINVKQPVAAAFVHYSASDDAYDFEIDNLAPDTYTIAWTCQADAEQPDVDDGLTFQDSETVTVSASTTSTVTFSN
ncbi:hypothetical protein [Solimonas terrae]|uniref:DUF4382 domain-containing protein n=1 Tax=Solimonas terrae TaxID=1396819 RepID=A0A6M2BWH9_9GAMM|nr:hypothetical protein [Solimonas terrae]NGY06946.1 hypothetical protein [Solimonas terrae]